MRVHNMTNLKRLFLMMVLVGLPWACLETAISAPLNTAVGGISSASSNVAFNAWSSQDYDFYAGDFNGDGFTDILYVAHSLSMPSGILLSDGIAPTNLGQVWASNYLGIPWSSGAYTILVGDFNGD